MVSKDIKNRQLIVGWRFLMFFIKQKKKAVKKEMQRISFDLVDHQGFEPQTP
ncbi:MAG: hypothetical protein SOY74_04490 [Allisonella histaminiformans]|nr:hypothetical protein [Allisonella histaminiformans]